jgi:hypothetical protein
MKRINRQEELEEERLERIFPTGKIWVWVTARDRALLVDMKEWVFSTDTGVPLYGLGIDGVTYNWNCVISLCKEAE